LFLGSLYSFNRPLVYQYIWYGSTQDSQVSNTNILQLCVQPPISFLLMAACLIWCWGASHARVSGERGNGRACVLERMRSAQQLTRSTTHTGRLSSHQSEKREAKALRFDSNVLRFDFSVETQQTPHTLKQRHTQHNFTQNQSLIPDIFDSIQNYTLCTEKPLRKSNVCF